jgi:hypothetical protein
MHAENMSDLQQRGNAGIGRAGLDGLIRGPGDAGGEEHALLGPVVVEAPDANAVADGAALAQEPVVVIGQGWHSTNPMTKIIISQPGQPGLF